MPLDRRRLLAAATTTLLAPAAARAQAPAGWRPSRPIRAIVPFAAGGPTDLLTRMLAEPVGAALGQPLVVENRTGAGGAIGAELVAKAPPDGHTILVHDSAHAVAPALVARLPFDPVTDFSGIGVLVFAPLVLSVNPRVPARSLDELLALLRANPGRFNMATSGVGGPVHIAAEILRTAANVQMEMVHYRGGAPAATAIVGGEAQMTILSIAASLEFIRAGTMRPIVLTVRERHPLLPDVPTSAEAGLPNFFYENWRAALAPAATPPAALAALSAAFQAGLRQIEPRLREVAEQPRPGFDTSAAVMAFIRREMENYTAVLRAAGVRPE
ncbi:tripartite tricarboxylate transporter substrate binding protein [Roseomonas alkaliterrae]|jgi:tripartite-type tricarboxylate transporter receptor subunit TctC|uniref:Tripartite-type tricarboxylate transporter receptor subunit TctC n=1 Tax=Neoroseomonas alkaliterrae TaxID=1452450 RepID=A0A840Y383_9PROT|nr:tripartite tricarboxylate transporter substrate-binding protein [Neoroseomonas alkaliterrae]MBB5689102.1 tripartite-type tricarboxylate transporter receptor subunit TctC [Neoroseomonas alkaliterrae]MBR0675263.1 tripartite tricarboxylate transporter substrate binding protein [Neoroseomonas alkaliterrae]